MMKMNPIILISPSKTMDSSSKDIGGLQLSRPQLIQHGIPIMQKLKEMSKSSLSKLMKLSPNLTEATYALLHNWQEGNTDNKGTPSIMKYTGDVYQGLSPQSFDADDMTFAQEHLYIFSAIYGVLRPLDQILPYRCEMGLKMDIQKSKNLTAYWRPIITNYLEQTLNSSDVIINLLSKEYSAAIDWKDISVPTITIDFKEWRNNQLKSVSFASKVARGTMASTIIKNRLSDMDAIKTISFDNYTFDKANSTESLLLFTR